MLKTILKGIALILTVYVLMPHEGQAGYCWKKVRYYSCFKESPTVLSECDAACKKFYLGKKNVKANSVERNSKACGDPFSMEGPSSTETACYCDYCK